MNHEFTVVIAAFNASQTISACVESAFEAGAKAVIVVDDGSTDSTSDGAEKAGAHVISQLNEGAARARDRGGAEVDTDYLVFLDADDFLVSRGVARSLEILSCDSELAAAGGQVIAIDVRGEAKPSRNSMQTVTTESLLVVGHGAWPPGAAVVRTASWRKAQALKPTPLRPPFAEDFETLIRLSLVGEVRRHEEPSLIYQLAGGKSARSAVQAIECKEQIRSYYASYLGIQVTLMSPRARLAAAAARVARAEFASGSRARGTKAMLVALYHRTRAEASTGLRRARRVVTGQGASS